MVYNQHIDHFSVARILDIFTITAKTSLSLLKDWWYQWGNEKP